MPLRRVSAVVGGAALLMSTAAVAGAEPAGDPAYYFDFQPSGAPLADGHVEVTETTAYSAARGFGFVETSELISRDRGGDPLTGDFVGGPEYEFVVDVPDGSYTVLAWAGDAIASNRTAFVVEGVDHGSHSTGSGTIGTHEFRDVVVEDGQLNVQLSGNPARINALHVLPTLAGPTDLRAVAVDASADPAQVELAWTSDFARYEVYRASSGGPADSLGTTAETTFTDATAEVGLTYEYHVVGTSDDGRESLPSETLVLTAVDDGVQPPEAPVDLEVSATDEAATLTWRAVDGAHSYDVERAGPGHADYERLARVGESRYVDSSILRGVDYRYRVVAVNAGGLSHPSSAVDVPAASGLVRQAETIDRAPVAVLTDEGMYIGWRMLGLDSQDIAFHVHRNGQRVTTEPVTTSTNYLDDAGTPADTYRISAVVEGEEIWATEEFTPWSEQYLEIPLDKPADGEIDGRPYTYHASDASIGDLTGDGTYEIVQIWNPSNAQDNSRAGHTGEVFIDAYTLEGERLWRIGMGPNIRAGAHYTQLVVYDLDGDGKAEVMVKTADGTVDGAGQVIGDPEADYRNGDGYVLDGPEYLTVFDGETGAAIDTVNYVPPRGNVADWGDGYGNRVDRFLAAVAYLDGEQPSAVFSRGYYTRTVLAAYDFDGEQLDLRWVFDSDEAGREYEGQGNHNLAVADVDGDGRDEIVFGAMTIDHDGTVLYNSDLGHGDAAHVGDFDPDRPGLEVFGVLECMSCSDNIGAAMRDAGTGEVLWSVPASRDTGRGTTGDIDPRFPGAESWSVGADGAWDQRAGSLRSAQGEEIATTIPAANFVTWWDGDLLREITDHDFDEETRSGVPTLAKWDWENEIEVELLRVEGTASNNDTKGTPVLQADLAGDWREELVYRTADSTALRLYTTDIPTEHRIRTLMHDPVYRLAVAWQNVAYNQPPHPGFFLGEGMAQPPMPSIRYVGDLPAPEPVAPTIGNLQGALATYVAAGDVGGPIAHQLTNAAELADRHLEGGRTRPAVVALDRFVRHLDHPKASDVLGPEAADDLRGRALALRADLAG